MAVLSDQVAVITGASSGIGEATAAALAEHGAKVVVSARRRERLEALVGRIADAGGEALAVGCDVTDRGQVQAMVERAMEAFGRIDILVSNAGVMPLAPMARCRVEDWESMVDVNVKGLLYGIGAVLPIMIGQKSGHIVNVSSTAGRRTFPNGAVYCGTKHAVHAISEGLRHEITALGQEDGSRIRVTIIAPGAVVTELLDSITDDETRAMFERWRDELRDPLRSDDVAEAIVYAVTAPGHVNVNEILVRPTGQVR